MTDCPNCAAYRAETRRMAVEAGGTYELAQEPVQAQLEATERALAFERASHRERCRLLYAASREITRLNALVRVEPPSQPTVTWHRVGRGQEPVSVCGVQQSSTDGFPVLLSAVTCLRCIRIAATIGT